MLEIGVETTTTAEITTTTSTTSTVSTSTSTMMSTPSQKMDNFLKELFGLKDHMKPKTQTTTASTTTTSVTTKKRTTKPVRVRPPSVVTRPGNRRPRPKSPLRPKSPTTTTTTAPRSSTTTQLDIVELLRTLEEQKRQEKKLNERLNVTTGETTTQTSLTSQNDNDEATLHFGTPEQERIRSNQETTEING